MIRLFRLILGIIFSVKFWGCNDQPLIPLEERCAYLLSVMDSSKTSQEVQDLRKGLLETVNIWVSSGVPSKQGYKTSNYKVYDGVIYNKSKNKAMLFIPRLINDIVLDDNGKYIGQAYYVGYLQCVMAFKINEQWVYSDRVEATAFRWYEGISFDDMVEQSLKAFILYENLVYPNKLEINYEHLEERHFPAWLYKVVYDDMMKK